MKVISLSRNLHRSLRDLASCCCTKAVKLPHAHLPANLAHNMVAVLCPALPPLTTSSSTSISMAAECNGTTYMKHEGRAEASRSRLNNVRENIRKGQRAEGVEQLLCSITVAGRNIRQAAYKVIVKHRGRRRRRVGGSRTLRSFKCLLVLARNSSHAHVNVSSCVFMASAVVFSVRCIDDDGFRNIGSCVRV